MYSEPHFPGNGNRKAFEEWGTGFPSPRALPLWRRVSGELNSIEIQSAYSRHIDDNGIPHPPHNRPRGLWKYYDSIHHSIDHSACGVHQEQGLCEPGVWVWDQVDKSCRYEERDVFKVVPVGSAAALDVWVFYAHLSSGGQDFVLWTNEDPLLESGKIKRWDGRVLLPAFNYKL